MMFNHAAHHVCLCQRLYHVLVSVLINIIFLFESDEIIVPLKGHLSEEQEESFAFSD